MSFCVCVVLEAVRVVHVIICKCVLQRGVALIYCCRSKEAIGAGGRGNSGAAGALLWELIRGVTYHSSSLL